MPLLNAALVHWIIVQARDYDVLIPQVAPGARARNCLGLESLHAISSRAYLPSMQRQLAQGNVQVLSFFPHVRVRMIDAATLRQFDPGGTAFANVNTPGDVLRVQAALRTGDEASQRRAMVTLGNAAGERYARLRC